MISFETLPSIKLMKMLMGFDSVLDSLWSNDLVNDTENCLVIYIPYNIKSHLNFYQDGFLWFI